MILFMSLECIELSRVIVNVILEVAVAVNRGFWLVGVLSEVLSQQAAFLDFCDLAALVKVGIFLFLESHQDLFEFILGAGVEKVVLGSMVLALDIVVSGPGLHGGGGACLLKVNFTVAGHRVVILTHLGLKIQITAKVGLSRQAQD